MSDAATFDMQDATPHKPKPVVVHDHAVTSPADQMTPMLMVDRAVQSGASIETLEKLMALQERWEANQARRAFDAAMAEARGEIKPIAKNRRVDFSSSKGRTSYAYEDLGEIARSVDPILAKHGLSYRYRTSSRVGEPIEVTCIISHRDGHSEENTLQAGRDESGNKNSIQAVGSTITFLQRYSLKAALGLAASIDDDGAMASPVASDQPSPSPTPIVVDEKQAADLRERIMDADADLPGFLRHFKIGRVEDMPASEYDRAVALLAKKKAQGKGAK